MVSQRRAMYPGWCKRCAQDIEPDDFIIGTPGGPWGHFKCPKP